MCRRGEVVYAADGRCRVYASDPLARPALVCGYMWGIRVLEM